VSDSSQAHCDADKESVPVKTVKSQAAVNHAKVTKVLSRGTNEAECGAKDLLILSPAFIKISENQVREQVKNTLSFGMRWLCVIANSRSSRRHMIVVNKGRLSTMKC
jgi:hypothetical protein